jgi:hypothetical protein
MTARPPTSVNFVTNTIVTFPTHSRRRYASLMATTTDKSKKYRCMQCEMTEDRCACEKFCCLCQSFLDVELGQDGLYYCKSCREACGY